MKTTPEHIWPSEEDLAKKEAWKYCEALQRAISIAADFRQEPSQENWTRLRDAQESIGRLSPRPTWGHKNTFQLSVTPGMGIRSYLSRDNEVLHNPGVTIVDTVDAIREDEVVFSREKDGANLVICGHDVLLAPVFEDELSEELPPDTGTIEQ